MIGIASSADDVRDRETTLPPSSRSIYRGFRVAKPVHDRFGSRSMIDSNVGASPRIMSRMAR